VPLPTTGPWQIFAGSIQGTLTFSGTTGVVSGEIEGELQFSGFFDEAAQTLSFMLSGPLVTESGEKGEVSTPFNVYQAQLFQVGSGASVYYVLTGVTWSAGNFLEVIYSSWYAQFPAPTKLPTPPHPPTPPTPHPILPHPITPHPLQKPTATPTPTGKRK
jgi:hypothetical protein